MISLKIESPSILNQFSDLLIDVIFSILLLISWLDRLEVSISFPLSINLDELAIDWVLSINPISYPFWL